VAEVPRLFQLDRGSTVGGGLLVVVGGVAPMRVSAPLGGLGPSGVE
jgi:hypothetical protein